jgi:hypothetical protein
VESIIVLYITAAASVFAYFWLYLMVDVISPKEIEIWEAAVTCAMFPLLLVVAWCADKGEPLFPFFSFFSFLFLLEVALLARRAPYCC